MSEPLAPARSAGAAAWSIVLALAVGLVVVACGSISAPRAPVVPDAPVVTSAPAATASPTSSAHTAAIAAFVESVASRELTYRIDYTGTVSWSSRTTKIKGSMTVAGEDFAAAWRYLFEGVPVHDFQVRGVNGKGYIKREGKAWASLKNYDLKDSYVPFKRVADTSNVKYLGPVEVGGKTLHRISIPEALLIHPTTIPYNVKKEKVEQLTLEVLIDDKGKPRTGTWELRSQARIGEGVGQLQRVVYQLELKFSKVGAKLTVKKP